MITADERVFDEKKTTALAIELLKCAGEKGKGKRHYTMPYLKLMKLLYFCDREMYKEQKRFITNDYYVSMKLGPVLSNTLSLIRNGDVVNDKIKINSFWKNHIRTKGYDVLLWKDIKEEPHLLDDAEMSIARKYGEMFRYFDEWQTVKIAHTVCTEWEDPTNSGLGVKPISLKAIRAALREEKKQQDRDKELFFSKL